MNDIRYPNITGGTEAAQLLQVKSYLHQLVDQLNMTLQDMGGGGYTAQAVTRTTEDSNAVADKEAQSTFNSIKALIIKSADIVNAYYQEINHRLEGVYVAESDFGDFAEQTAHDIKVASDRTEEIFSSLQAVISRVDGIASQTIEANAYINSGLLYYNDAGVPVYGLEIGQRNEIDGVEVFNKFARFTAEKLSFYDQNGSEVAYISDRKLYITHVEITGTFVLGWFMDTAQSDGSIVTKWIGMGGEG